MTPLQERQLRARGGLKDVPSAEEIERLRHEVKALEFEIQDANNAPPTVPAELAPTCVKLSFVGMESGVYLLLRNDLVVYVGSSISVVSRVAQHVQERGTPAGKDFDAAVYIACNPDERLAIEGALIRLLRPEHNGNAPASDGDDERILISLGIEPHPKLALLSMKRQRLSQMRSARSRFLYGPPTTIEVAPKQQPRPPAARPAWHPEFAEALEVQRRKRKQP